MLPSRESILRSIYSRTRPWDVLVIGGGATGMGCALDAASRGYEVLLVERADFGSGTSSRSTKIIHGGIRYLRTLQWSLVRESLEERELLRQLAPHVVRVREFVVPFYSRIDQWAIGAAVRLYTRMAPSRSTSPFNGAANLSPTELQAAFPALSTRSLRGGIQYRDGQFDDVRLLLSIAKTAVNYGATLLNYCGVTGVRKNADGRVIGVTATDTESGGEFTVDAKVVINATGPYSDRVQSMAGDCAPHVLPSQGIHLVFDQTLFPSTSAVVIPKTLDKRVMFLIPWREKLLVGTTDHVVESVQDSPQPRAFEIQEVLQTVGPYFQEAPKLSDIRAAFAGLRPLAVAGYVGPSASISRDFALEEHSGSLLAVRGGKWTSYRRMAAAAVDRAARMANLPHAPSCTAQLPLHGSSEPNYGGRLEGYGSDAREIEALEASDPMLREPLSPDRPETVGQVVYAVRHEMARTVEDVLARRLRTLFLDSSAAMAQASRVATILSAELGFDRAWQILQLERLHQSIAQPSC